MALLNTSERYGLLTKAFHWLIVVLFAIQYVSGHAVMEHFGKGNHLGIDRWELFTWHKSFGVVVLGVVIFRILNRSLTILPNWAPTLSNGEKKLIHRYEWLLYAGMLIMPLSGFVYSMAGGWGLHFFWVYKIPNPFGKIEALSQAALYVHIVSAWIILSALVLHLVVVFRHQLFVRDNLLARMGFRFRS